MFQDISYTLLEVPLLYEIEHVIHRVGNLTEEKSCVNIVTRTSYSRRGFGLVIAFIDYFNTQLVTALNYSSIANFHTINESLAYTLILSQLAVSSLVVAS
jgi:hypothetical protein